ncbi:SLOG family protein [Salirhabdus sp. Marseille-P4669]|uniref:SLOG family protein n=1 Tax=Salirhabdus sp. Marseille-P4669 TaxID=2042310 RepID=UPI000C7D79A6|nr:DUF1273 domain-containing protein [Salirhabdus sp. Marseille-P4669]
MKNLYVTGYKPHELNIFNSNDKRILFIKESIKRRITQLVEEYDVMWVIISGQAGVELWAAEVVLSLKAEYGLKLAVVPPFQNQEVRWKEEQQSLYHSIIEQADFFQPLMNKAYEGPMQFKRKDQWVIDKTDGCLVVFDEENGGSPTFFLREVEKKNKKDYQVFYITAFDLEDTVREMEMNEMDVHNGYL